MTISKKLLLLATLSLTLGSHLGASNYAIPCAIPQQDYATIQQVKNQNIFNFALNLKQQDDEQAHIAADWLEKELLYSSNYIRTDEVILVLNAHLTLEEKIAYILDIKTNQEERIAKWQADTDKRQKECDDEATTFKQQQIKKYLAAGLAMIAGFAIAPALCTFSEHAGRKLALAALGA